MKAAMMGLLLAACATSALHAQATATGKWVPGTSMEGHDAISTPATEGGRAILDVFCPPGGPSIRMQLGRALGNASDASVRVQVKFVDVAGEPPTAWMLQFSPTNSLLTLPRARVQQFIGRAKRAPSMTVRLTDPLNVTPIDLAFSLEGFPDALKALSCTKDM